MTAEGFIKVSDLAIGLTQVAQDGIRFDLTRVAAPYNPEYAASPNESLEVTVSVTVGDGDPALAGPLKLKRKLELHATPDGGEVDLWREQERALSGIALMGLTKPAYKWREKWPTGRAQLTHRASNVILRWKRTVPTGTEVVLKVTRIVNGEVAEASDLVAYIEDGQLPSQPPGEVDTSQKPEDKEPILRQSEMIQGNILAGFNKPHQEFLLFHLPDKPDARPHQWLHDLSFPPDRKAKPLITDTADVTVFKEDFKTWQAAQKQAEPPMDATKPDPVTWVNLGLTFAGLCRLHPQFEKEQDPAEGDIGLAAFRQGPADRADQFGAIGNNAPDKWDFGGKNDKLEIHAILTIAADEKRGLEDERERQLRLADDHGVRLIGDPYRGDRLTGAVEGREHFGFREGISQPGVKGYSRPSRDDPLEDADHPGSRIVDSKHFVFDADSRGWLQNGSMQVFERLEQDVRMWREEVNRVSGHYSIEEAIAPILFEAKLIGRWPSGTPLALAPIRDYRPTFTTGDNRFSFDNDPKGERTPLCAHIRKQNPRTGEGNDARRILRRGIPYGPPFPDNGKDDAGAERGLLFNAFITDIEAQFEKPQQEVNDPDEQGPDALVGTSRQGDQFRLPQVGVDRPSRFSLKQFVRIRGVVYAFAPSIPVLRKLAKKDLAADDLKALGLERPDDS